MSSRKTPIAVGLTLLLLGSIVGPAAAHETQNVKGYEITFGGAEEPLITGERMWLEFEIVDNETGEPVTNQSENLTASVQTQGSDKTALELSEKHGEPGVYEAPVIFTEAGNYTVHLEGEINGTPVHTHFQKEVQDRDTLKYPAPDAQATDDGNTSQSEENQTEQAGFGSLGVVIVGLAGVAAGGVYLLGRHR
ncbi:FixH family protein (plasmid) [Natrinema zhouii]|uniref:FixH family protein n=1 Tax=Natrinema zhouii TaxID=1710539 RepID=UPI001CFFC576|nr:FixH family protein [Natrinema zhouii]UHQ98166.1 FixH family protein [Natrinema zhouii]